MGVYSTREYSYNYGADIPVDESYFGINGALNAMISIENNNQAIFERTLGRDFEAAIMLHEGANSEKLYYFNEATIGGFIDKVKAMVKKIWEKIKGIFSTFLRKLDGVIIRDNKKLVEKYQKEVRLKDLSKLKYKWQQRKKGFDELKGKMTSPDTWIKESNTAFHNFDKDDTVFKKIKDDVEDGEYYSRVISDVLGLKNVELNELSKEIHDLCFDSEESEEGLKSDRLTDIIQVLKGDKTKSEIDKAQTAANKHFKKLMDNLDSISNQINKNVDTDENKKGQDIKDLTWKNTDFDDDKLDPKDRAFNGNAPSLKISNQDASKYMQRAGTLQTAISQIETVHTNTISCFLNENKFNITQSRKVFLKAASYNPKKAKNEAAEIYLDALEEAAEYEINSLFEDYSLDLNEYDYGYEY